MKVALVLGGADCLWSDVTAALDLGEFGAVVACNDASAVWPGRLDAAVSLHADKLRVWMDRRQRGRYPPAAQVLASDTVARASSCVTGFTPYRFPGQAHSGSSGLFALKVALVDLGCERAVLCGVPMNAEGAHFFDPRPWSGANAHRRGWNEALPLIRDRARSMSGWTRELLGAPTEEWFRP